MALRGRLLSKAGLEIAGLSGVVRLPGRNAFAAVVWNLDQRASLAACASYHQENAACDVLTPEAFAEIAEAATTAKAKKEMPVAQGSDGLKPVKKKKKKKR
jgi:hypothetical protein